MLLVLQGRWRVEVSALRRRLRQQTGGLSCVHVTAVTFFAQPTQTSCFYFSFFFSAQKGRISERSGERRVAQTAGVRRERDGRDAQSGRHRPLLGVVAAGRVGHVSGGRHFFDCNRNVTVRREFLARLILLFPLFRGTRQDHEL